MKQIVCFWICHMSHSVDCIGNRARFRALDNTTIPTYIVTYSSPTSCSFTSQTPLVTMWMVQAGFPELPNMPEPEQLQHSCKERASRLLLLSMQFMPERTHSWAARVHMADPPCQGPPVTGKGNEIGCDGRWPTSCRLMRTLLSHNICQNRSACALASSQYAEGKHYMQQVC